MDLRFDLPLRARRHELVVIGDGAAAVRFGLDLEGRVAGVRDLEQEARILAALHISRVQLRFFDREHRLWHVDGRALLRAGDQHQARLLHLADLLELDLGRLPGDGGTVRVRAHEMRGLLRWGETQVGPQRLAHQVRDGRGRVQLVRVGQVEGDPHLRGTARGRMARTGWRAIQQPLRADEERLSGPDLRDASFEQDAEIGGVFPIGQPELHQPAQPQVPGMQGIPRRPEVSGADGSRHRRPVDVDLRGGRQQERLERRQRLVELAPGEQQGAPREGDPLRLIDLAGDRRRSGLRGLLDAGPLP